MNPVDFFETAESLKQSNDEADLRTAVGRSYYGAFLHFREHLKSKGLQKKDARYQAHAFVINCLSNSNTKAGSKASEHLRQLQQLREDADYHLDKVITQNEAADAIVKARRVVNNFQSEMTSTEEQLFIQNAQRHAKLKEWI